MAKSLAGQHLYLKHLHNAEMPFPCPQTFLSLECQSRDDDVSELKYKFRDWKELM